MDVGNHRHASDSVTVSWIREWYALVTSDVGAIIPSFSGALHTSDFADES